MTKRWLWFRVGIKIYIHHTENIELLYLPENIT